MSSSEKTAPSAPAVQPGKKKPRIKVPGSATLLGYAGLIPFAGTALIVWLSWPSPAARDALFALQAYGAVILSFLGGARWGLAMAGHGYASDTETRRELRMGLTAAVLPSVIAWLALLMPPLQALSVLIICYGGQYLADIQTVKAGDAPVWYRLLRTPLTLLAMAAMLAALARLIIG